MTGDSTDFVAEQKALLRARAELDRTRLAFAMQEILAVVAPDGANVGAAPRRPGLAAFVGILASMFGARKAARWARFASLALTAFRLVRNWRRMH